MKLNVMATASSFAVVVGMLMMFVTGIAHMIWPSYGQAFLDVMASVYPGYDAGPTFKQALIGTLYGLLDGFIVGAVLALAYNRYAGKTGAS